MTLKYETKLSYDNVNTVTRIMYFRCNEYHRKDGHAYISTYPIPHANDYLYGVDTVGSYIFLEIEYFRLINDAWDNPVKMRTIPAHARAQWLRHHKKGYKQSLKIVSKDEAIEHLQLVKNSKGLYKAGRYGHYDALN